MSGTPIAIICICCDQPGLHGGRGLIHACYTRHAKAGTLHQYPSVRGNREWQETRRIPTLAPGPQPEPDPLADDDGSWEERAACRYHDPELWFPLGDGDSLQVQEAKAICRACPVLADCAAWITANPQDHGIWAATTPRERRRQRAHNLERSTA